MNYSKGQYVVLLASCDGSNQWHDSMPINFCYKLAKNADINMFYPEKDITGSTTNGWFVTPGGSYESLLSMRLATYTEARQYQKLDKPFDITIPFQKTELKDDSNVIDWDCLVVDNIYYLEYEYPQMIFRLSHTDEYRKTMYEDGCICINDKTFDYNEEGIVYDEVKILRKANAYETNWFNKCDKENSFVPDIRNTFKVGDWIEIKSRPLVYSSRIGLSGLDEIKYPYITKITNIENPDKGWNAISIKDEKGFGWKYDFNDIDNIVETPSYDSRQVFMFGDMKYHISGNQKFHFSNNGGNNAMIFKKLGIFNKYGFVSTLVGYTVNKGDFPEVRTLTDMGIVIRKLKQLWDEKEFLEFMEESQPKSVEKDNSYIPKEKKSPVNVDPWHVKVTAINKKVVEEYFRKENPSNSWTFQIGFCYGVNQYGDFVDANVGISLTDRQFCEKIDIDFKAYLSVVLNKGCWYKYKTADTIAYYAEPGNVYGLDNELKWNGKYPFSLENDTELWEPASYDFVNKRMQSYATIHYPPNQRYITKYGNKQVTNPKAPNYIYYHKQNGVTDGFGGWVFQDGQWAEKYKETKPVDESGVIVTYNDQSNPTAVKYPCDWLSQKKEELKDCNFEEEKKGETKFKSPESFKMEKRRTRKKEMKFSSAKSFKLSK